MPIYRYQCTECGAREEHLQKVSDPPLEACEACGGTLSKLMTAAAFHLKGGGWYVTDFKDKSKPKDESKKADDARPKEADKTESKTTSTETAPATSKSETVANE